jgi:hypothetical protein
MTQQRRQHYPTPETLWGDCTIKSWDRKARGWFGIWLNALASMLPYASQETINKINALVLLTIKQANAGSLSPNEAISKIIPKQALTIEEIFHIKKQRSLYGLYTDEDYTIN